MKTLRGRYAPLAIVVTLFLAVATLTRLVLFARSVPQVDGPWLAFPLVMTVGLLYDAVAAVYLFAPLALYLFFVPERIYQSRVHRALAFAGLFVLSFGVVYLAGVEYFFFDEFDARFNLVAVDYLIYPHEVFVNIWESYPVGRVLAGTAVAAAGVMWFVRRRLAESYATPSRYRTRLPLAAAWIALLALCLVGIDSQTGRVSPNRITNELAQDGAYSFFASAFTNELAYDAYYTTIPEAEAAARVRRLVAQPNAAFLPGAANPLARHIDNPGTPQTLNVVLLVQESLGADWVGAYGDTRGLTPSIDAMAKDGLTFTNVYATGTRTVRGLEAVSASFPPIPSESIVKRPRNEGIFTWAEVMHRAGYTPTWIYGGFGTFDNMNYYFGHNGYEVHDRTDMPTPSFSNIWGVSDVDLFKHAVTVFDLQHARGQRIFSVIMSTSNHKPFTFPDGVPGVRPTGGGRESGVRYSDHAIGAFMAEARTRPWFKDTVFVVVGDHGARVYGKEDIPLRSYELPLVFYSPAHIAPRTVDVLASQIDIMPTLLGLLHVSYDTVGFGRDILAGDPTDRFVMVSHNHDVGLLRHGHLEVLGIRKTSHEYRYDRATNTQVAETEQAEDREDAVALYQVGAAMFERQQYRLGPARVSTTASGAVD